MLIYIVIAQYANGYREERAFAFHRAARTYAAAQADEAETMILEVPVLGDVERPGVAYTIRWDDLTEDTENIEAVYGNALLARFAVGRHGQVELLRIDDSTDASEAILTLPSRISHNVVNFRHGMRQNRMQRLRRRA
ncbi:MAG TPA: hypothetical protein VEC35_20400 [Noviherbaspirillum sp.]|nr:hypothetical protein [Noviherbaspirillum sp.]